MLGKETPCEKSSQVGNVAAMREALAQFVEYSDLVCRMGMFNRERLVTLTKKVRDVLCAPSRNCDRPECATTKAAQDVWRKEDGGKTAYYEWLLAAATKGEKK